MDLAEEFADLFTNMAISYDKDAQAQGKKYMGGAFLNGYQTAVLHIYQQLNENPGTIFTLPEHLKQLLLAFDEMARRGGVQPQLTLNYDFQSILLGV